MKRKSEGSLSSHGYLRFTTNGSRIYGHKILIESVLGKPIPKGAVCHHIDGNKTNNINSNLILCDSDSYHHFLHRRERALKECGHSGWIRCGYCSELDDPKNMYIHKRQTGFHRECQNKYKRDKCPNRPGE